MSHSSQPTSSSLPSMSPLSSSSSSPSSTRTIPTLHSPPSQFIGTPFTTPSSATSPFEYPFPKDSPSNSTSTVSSTGSSPGSVGNFGNSHYNHYPLSGVLPPGTLSSLSSATSSTFSIHSNSSRSHSSTGSGSGSGSSASLLIQDSRRRGSMPLPVNHSALRNDLSNNVHVQNAFGLRSSTVPVPPSLIEKAKRRGKAV